MATEIEQKLVDFCVNIYAHSMIDAEVNIEGNGINASEASGVADGILRIMGVKDSKINKAIKLRVKELEKEYGYDA